VTRDCGMPCSRDGRGGGATITGWERVLLFRGGKKMSIKMEKALWEIIMPSAVL